MPLELLVLAHVARDHLLDLPGPQQLADALTIDPGIIRNKGQMLRSCLLDRVEQPLGHAAQTEAARCDRHAVEQQTVEHCFSTIISLIAHGSSPSSVWTSQHNS